MADSAAPPAPARGCRGTTPGSAAAVTERAITLAEAYDQHVYDVHAFFGYGGLRREDAEDLTQATFERALRAWHRYDPRRASVKTWLLAIARNLMIDHRRRSGRREQVPLPEDSELLAAGGDRGDGSADHHLGPALHTALATLSAREREVIALRFGGQLSGPEIADLTGLTLANVQQIASRALRRLRAEIEREAAAARG